MPKYVFECPTCVTQFTRTLGMGEHPNHACPSCKGMAPRCWAGQGFGFDFAATAGTDKANSGVAKHDYPTDDQIVGRTAESRWEILHGRQKVKEKVREVGATRALIRQDKPGYTEYVVGGDQTVAKRKAIVKEANVAYQKQREDQ